MSRTEQNSLCDRGRYGAFSLIELLVVLGVIAVLMATLLPVLGKARKQGRSVVCLHNVRRLALSGVMYAQANEAFPPHRMKRKSFFDTDNFVNKYGRDRPRWPWFFDEGIGPVIDPAPWVKQPGDVFTDAETMLMTNDNFICPSFRHAEYNVYDIRNGSYGYNYQYLGNARDRPDLGTRERASSRRTLVQTRSAQIGPQHRSGILWQLEIADTSRAALPGGGAPSWQGKHFVPGWTRKQLHAGRDGLHPGCEWPGPGQSFRRRQSHVHRDRPR